MTDWRANLGAQRKAAAAKRCRHPRADRSKLPNGDSMCCRCEHIIPKERSARGRSSRSRGTRRELELAKQLDGEKVGHHNGPEDVRLPLLNVQSKVTSATRKSEAFSEWYWDELQKLPRTGGRLPAVIVTGPPGPADLRRRRSIVVMDLDDFTDLHGRVDKENHHA